MNSLSVTAQQFPIMGRVLEISEEMAVFNHYRIMFRDGANWYANAFQRAYMNQIQNLDAFLELFPRLYDTGLQPVVQKAVDILFSYNVWTVTCDSFLAQHKKDFHLAMDDYDTMMESFNLTLEANQKRRANNASYVPNVTFFGRGLGGLVAGAAKSVAYHAARDSLSASYIRNAQVTPAQRVELYNRLKLPVLFDRVYSDYWNVFLSLIWTINQNGGHIWWPNKQKTQQANNIFQNLSNPNFPQNRVLDALLDIIRTNPFQVKYFRFLQERFGRTPEIDAVCRFFGFTDFNNARIR